MCDKNITESITIPKEKFLEYIIQSKKQTEKDKKTRSNADKIKKKKQKFNPKLKYPIWILLPNFQSQEIMSNTIFCQKKQTNILEPIKDICDMCDKQVKSSPKKWSNIQKKLLTKIQNKAPTDLKKERKKQKPKIANQNYNLEHKSSVPQEDIKISLQKLEYNKGILRLAKVYVFHKPYIYVFN